MNYLKLIFNFVNRSFSIFGFVKKVLAEKTLIAENKKLHAFYKNATKFMLWWSVGNIVISVAMIFFATGKLYYFLQMNNFWNVFFAILFIAIYLKVKKSSLEEDELSTWPLIEKISKTEKLFAFGIGICISFIVTGGFLIDRGFIFMSDIVIGFGAAILFQGLIFLSLMTIFYLLNRRSSKIIFGILRDTMD